MRGALITACLSMALAISAALPADAVPEDLPVLYVNATGPLTPLDHSLLAVPQTGGSYKSVNNAPDRVALGDTIVLWVVSHDDGRKEAYRQVVTARDVDPPVFVGAPPVLVVEENGRRTAVHFEIPAARDTVDLDVDVSSSPEPGSKFRTGNTTVSFTATDGSGNSAVHEMVVVVTDRRITNLVLDASHDRIRATWDPLSGNPEYRASISVPGGDPIERTRTSGTSHVFSRLEASTEYVVTVAAVGERGTALREDIRTTERGDRSATMPPDVVREASAPLTPVHLGGVITSPGWDPAPSISNDAPAAFPVGSTNVTWTVTDGETTIVGKQQVTITDTTKPVFIDAQELYRHVMDSEFEAAVQFRLPNATDAADPDVVVTSSHDPGSEFGLGSTTVVFTATDYSGNSAVHEMVVVVTDPRVKNLDLEVTHNVIRASWDPLPGNPQYEASISGPGGLIEAAKTHGIAHLFRGLDSDTEYVVAVATAGDAATTTTRAAATLDPLRDYVTIPPDVVREATAPLTPVDIGEADVSAGWDPAPSVSSDAPTAFRVGNTTVTWTITDGETTVEGEQLVTIKDTTKPVFIDPPESSTYLTNRGNTAVVSIPTPAATDAADPDVEVSRSRDGNTYYIGNTTVTFTARDDSGNDAVHSIVITVIPDPRQILVQEDFSSLEGWEPFEFNRVHTQNNIPLQLWGPSINNFTATLDRDFGMPSPSVAISGNGDHVTAGIHKTFDMDPVPPHTSIYIGGSLRLSDTLHKIPTPDGLYFAWTVGHITIHKGSWFAMITPTAQQDDTWYTISASILSHVYIPFDLGVAIVTYGAPDKHVTAHFDNLFVLREHPSREFRGGSADPPLPEFRGGSADPPRGEFEPSLTLQGSAWFEGPDLPIAPAIRFTGAEEIDHRVNTEYVEPGVICDTGRNGTWAAESDMSALDVTKPGKYHIGYSCVGTGLTTSVYRTVNVVE